MPALRQASMSSVPAGAVSFFPSTVKVTSGIFLRAVSQQLLNHGHFNMLGERAGLAVQVVFKFLAELLHEAHRGHGRCIAERAEGAAHHVFGEVADVVDVFGDAETGVETGERSS